MSISVLSKEFFDCIEQRVGPFDRPFQFRVFPFDSGGALNFLTVRRGGPFVTYVSWDLLGHEQQKRGSLSRYELLAECNDEAWCVDILTKIGRQGLREVFEPGDTFDIGPWVPKDAAVQGVVFEDAFSTQLGRERCGLLRCVGVTRPELDFAREHGVPALVQCLKRAGIYPRTVSGWRESVEMVA